MYVLTTGNLVAWINYLGTPIHNGAQMLMFHIVKLLLNKSTRNLAADSVRKLYEADVQHADRQSAQLTSIDSCSFNDHIGIHSAQDTVA